MSCRYRVVTLGCRTNQYESQGWRDQLEGVGYVPAGVAEVADLCIVNTCTVTQGADSHSRNAIRKLVRENPGTRMVVTGCFAEGQREAVLAIPGVTDVIGNSAKERLVEQLFPDVEGLPEFQIKRFEAHTRAFVKVQDGCNSFCTYCIIPYVRGRSRSRTVDSVVAEVEGLVASGYKEIVLTGINIGDFDGGNPEEPVSLAELVRQVDRVLGLERLRLSSIDPDEVDEPLMEAILGGEHTCHSLHIVLQAGSNVVLKRMNRKYTRQQFMEAIDKLRAASPHFTFTTDIIVGFPGETDADFLQTLDVVEQVQFAKAHIFPYSPRERTRAALWKDQVAPAIVQKWKSQLIQAAERSAFALRQRYVGERAWVLTEGADSGHTPHFFLVQLPQGEFAPNQLIEVELVANTPAGFEGAAVCQQVAL